jgi:hypothetical protein
MRVVSLLHPRGLSQVRSFITQGLAQFLDAVVQDVLDVGNRVIGPKPLAEFGPGDARIMKE